ncbi:MAG: preprotein translocase subunit SecE [Rickettsiaceae bacterium]|nr:preprotein translocase subunit SecE [Rickettsiaceae bacterium]
MVKVTKIFKFFEQVKQEAQKVIWPEKKELMTSVMVVIIAVFLFSVVTLILDIGINNLVKFLLNIGK